MPFRWPSGFGRIPDEDWTRQPLDDFARGYDALASHGWYANLEPTVAELAALLHDGQIVLDYSAGTGILASRLLAKTGPGFGVVNVDSSPKFLRLCLEKFRGEDRAAFRLIRYRKDLDRLQSLDEVVPELSDRADAIVSTNAVHLYYELPATFASWTRVLRPGGKVLVQSGNIPLPEPDARRIIDATVDGVRRGAEEIVREEPRYTRYRAVLDDPVKRAEYELLHRKYFLPLRSLDHYRNALERAGIRVTSVEHRTIRVQAVEWAEFLQLYDEGILGWIGGAEKVEGRAPDPEALADRREVLRRSLERALEGARAFDAVWTYIRGERA